MTKISHISWGGYDKGFYGIAICFYIFDKIKQALFKFTKEFYFINDLFILNKNA